MRKQFIMAMAILGAGMSVQAAGVRASTATSAYANGSATSSATWTSKKSYRSARSNEQQAMDFLIKYNNELERKVGHLEFEEPESFPVPRIMATSDVPMVGWVNPFTASYWVDASIGFLAGELVSSVLGSSSDANTSCQNYTKDLDVKIVNQIKIKDGDAHMSSANSFILNGQYSEAATELVHALGNYMSCLPYSAAHIMPVLVVMEKNYSKLAVNRYTQRYDYNWLQTYNNWTHNQYREVLNNYNSKLDSSRNPANLTNYRTFDNILRNNGTSAKKFLEVLKARAQLWKSGRKFPPRGTDLYLYRCKMSDDGFLVTIRHGLYNSSSTQWFRIWNHDGHDNLYGIWFDLPSGAKRFLRLNPSVSWGPNNYYAWGAWKRKGTSLASYDYKWRFTPYGDDLYIISTTEGGGKFLYPYDDGLVGTKKNPSNIGEVGKFNLYRSWNTIVK